MTTDDFLMINGDTKVGRMGDTGNATSDPQLHMEIHLPQGAQALSQGPTFTCTRCDPDKVAMMTAFNPFPSLSNALARKF